MRDKNEEKTGVDYTAQNHFGQLNFTRQATTSAGRTERFSFRTQVKKKNQTNHKKTILLSHKIF